MRGAALLWGHVVLLCSIAACSIGAHDRARDMVEAIPAYPSAEYVGAFETSPPDDALGAGVTYQSDADPNQIVVFYENALAELGWAIEEVHVPDDAAVPKRIVAEQRSWRCRLLVIPEPGADRYLISIWVGHP
jgi:hypothetical protein